MSGHLEMWTVYDHPKDYPEGYIARRSEVRGEGVTVMTADIVLSSDLEAVRDAMRNLGLVCLARDPNDDPVIVEVWL